MRKKFTLSGLSLLIFVLLSGLVLGQNPVYIEETFTYDDQELDATSVTNLNEGIGWLNEWNVEKDATLPTFNISYGVAEVIGNSVRTFEEPLTDNGDTIWIYTKLRSGTASTAGYAGISLWNGGSEDFFIGQEWDKTVDAVRGGGWQGPNYTSTIDATKDVEFLIELITMGEGEDDSVYVWLNPRIRKTVPAIADTSGSFSFSMPETYEFLSLRSDQTVYCDYIKIGTDIKRILDLNTSSNQILRTDFSLNNYPNPVKTATNISYSLQESGKIGLELFDTNGRIVKAYTNLDSQTGHHSFKIDVADLHSGLYYYRLTQNNSSTTNKMVVIK